MWRGVKEKTEHVTYLLDTDLQVVRVSKHEEL